MAGSQLPGASHTALIGPVDVPTLSEGRRCGQSSPCSHQPGHVPSSSRPFGGDSFPSQLLRLFSVSLKTLSDDPPVPYLSLVFCGV